MKSSTLNKEPDIHKILNYKISDIYQILKEFFVESNELFEISQIYKSCEFKPLYCIKIYDEDYEFIFTGYSLNECFTNYKNSLIYDIDLDKLNKIEKRLISLNDLNN